MAAELDSHAVASDMIDFLNASPTAFHAVGKSKSLLTHSLFVPFRRGKEAFAKRGVPPTLGEGTVETSTGQQVLLHQKPLHHRRLRHRQKVRSILFLSIFQPNKHGTIILVLIIMSLFFNLSGMFLEMDST